MSNLDKDIQKFNEMYGLPAGTTPSLEAVGDFLTRLKNFRKIMDKELIEADDLVTMQGDFEPGLPGWKLFKKYSELTGSNDKTVITLVMLADWLGDISVYATSELKRYGMSPETVISIIMQSNFTKLGADGKAIINDQGKVEKGPNFVPPEAELAKYIMRQLAGGQPKQPKFKLGDEVMKVSGSTWSGTVVGTYSTKLTPEGYAVESDSHPGSVQIYPANALQLAGTESD